MDASVGKFEGSVFRLSLPRPLRSVLLSLLTGGFVEAVVKRGVSVRGLPR